MVQEGAGSGQPVNLVLAVGGRSEPVSCTNKLNNGHPFHLNCHCNFMSPHIDFIYPFIEASFPYSPRAFGPLFLRSTVFELLVFPFSFW